MAIIFSAGGLERVRPRCVCQSFINHNAVLYKVFVVGESHTLVERPSLKNFPSGPAGEEPHTNSYTHTHTQRARQVLPLDVTQSSTPPPLILLHIRARFMQTDSQSALILKHT